MTLIGAEQTTSSLVVLIYRTSKWQQQFLRKVWMRNTVGYSGINDSLRHPYADTGRKNTMQGDKTEEYGGA